MKKIAVFVSGGGTNLQALMDACQLGTIQGSIQLVVADNDACYALVRAAGAGISTYVHDRKKVRVATETEKVEQVSALVAALKQAEIDLIVLAGYLSIIPSEVIGAYSDRIVNVHPALIPKYSGKGWYGDRIHTAVLENGDVETGVTVHYVDGGIDTGRIIEQVKVSVMADDTLETLRARIHGTEHILLVKIVSELCR